MIVKLGSWFEIELYLSSVYLRVGKRDLYWDPEFGLVVGE
jgi:hypothetical protein